MAAPRINYAVNAIGFGGLGTSIDSPSGWRRARGVQSAGSNVSFNLEKVFELGQLDVYENIEDLPIVEFTAEKVIDGYALLQHLSTPGATSSSLGGRYNDSRCSVILATYPYLQEGVSGFPLAAVYMSGLYMSSINFTFNVQGNSTESCTWVGNHRVWDTTWGFKPWSTGTGATDYTGLEGPLVTGKGVQRRENIIMGISGSIWPTIIPGVSGNGYNPLMSDGFYSAHIQDVTVGMSLGRGDLFELGSRGPYFRFAEFPTEVTTTINLTTSEFGDTISAYPDRDNLTDQQIIIKLEAGVTVDLGTKNKLQSVDLAAGDTGGSNMTASYTFTNSNFLRVIHSSGDPAGLSS